ncbi:Kinase D-interacting substrate [Tetrabaena socialis]|uniref:Kinase D-interacting substrate n=1 Tax=Tetrabaena socialis TaxID=47790 RepID=A0A2J8AB58_9CHLO|nr:Kinase D-interacting substrate [Tetrabaena socialis]|eukprot:PNH09703.1 Kinase D-interacting substrate [Tetrabaena socialis]
MQNGITALIIACKQGLAEVAKALLAAGAYINAKDTDGKTTLMHACDKGHAEVAKALLAAGADVNAMNTVRVGAWAINGWGCMVAVVWRRGNGEGGAAAAQLILLTLFKLLGSSYMLDHRCWCIQNGITALILACKQGLAELAKALLAAGAYINANDKDGKTTLMHACDKGHVEVAKALLAAGADVNAKNKVYKDGITALILACKQGLAEVATELLAAGADIHVKNTVWGW